MAIYSLSKSRGLSILSLFLSRHVCIIFNSTLFHLKDEARLSFSFYFRKFVEARYNKERDSQILQNMALKMIFPILMLMKLLFI